MDEAEAYVMTSLERARDLPHRPAVVAGVGFGSKPVPQSGYFSQSADLLTTAATRSGPRAFRQAGSIGGDTDFSRSARANAPISSTVSPFKAR